MSRNAIELSGPYETPNDAILVGYHIFPSNVPQGAAASIRTTLETPEGDMLVRVFVSRDPEEPTATEARADELLTKADAVDALASLENLRTLLEFDNSLLDEIDGRKIMRAIGLKKFLRSPEEVENLRRIGDMERMGRAFAADHGRVDLVHPIGAEREDLMSHEEMTAMIHEHIAPELQPLFLQLLGPAPPDRGPTAAGPGEDED